MTCCSKTVTATDSNFEEQLLQWYNEIDSGESDAENDVDEDFALESNHDADSGEEGTDEDVTDEEAIDQSSKKNFYGKNRFKWSSVPFVSRSRTLQHNIIVKLPGLRPVAKVGNTATPLTVWSLLLSDEMYDIIIQWTNKKIQALRWRYKNQNSPTLKDIDRMEMNAFLGLLAFTAVFKSNNENINTIFATNGTGREIIRCIMTKERFAFLLICLRFDNPEDREIRRSDEPAAAISEIFNIFVRNSQNCYSIGEAACIDEMLVGFRGRCKFKMYLPNKPTKYGIKVMCLTDALSPKIKCTSGVMKIEVPISESTRNVYLDGLKEYPDIACRPQRDSTGTLTVFELDLSDVFRCATTRITNKLTGRQIYYQTVIIEEGEGDLSTRETLHVKCGTPTPSRNHTITRRNVLPVGFQEQDVQVTEEYTSNAPKPELGVGVRQGGKLVTGELNVSPGTPLQMEIYLSEPSAQIYGLLVTHMQVTDTKTQEETIIYNGCSVDPYLFENFNTIDGDFLTAKFKAFKFPDSTYVQFKGTVNVCLDKCKGVECSAGQIGYGRRKREISTLPADPNKIFEITITSILKFGDEEMEDLKNDLKFMLDKKLYVADQLRDKFYHSEEDPSHLRIEEVSGEFVTGVNSSTRMWCIQLVVLPLLAVIYRLFV